MEEKYKVKILKNFMIGNFFTKVKLLVKELSGK